jgi:hypothetical protein
MTDACENVCYARRTERVFTTAGALVMHNWMLLKDATAAEQFVLLDQAVETFRDQAWKYDAPLVFRIHWDGDFFSLQYAKAWAKVIKYNPDVRFWVYTRSFVPGSNYIRAFKGLGNLSLYLSVDEDNVKHARKVTEKHPWVRWATMGRTFQDSADLVVGQPAGPPCPEQTKRVPLVHDDGRGACVACGLCIDGNLNVRFSTSKK